jgi:type II secretory pathway pseudopilin PulG
MAETLVKMEEGPLLVAIALGAVVTGGYILLCFRYRQGNFSFLDACLVVAIWAIGSAVAYPWVWNISQQTKAAALQQTLHTLRTQIQRYRMDHGGTPPVLFEGRLPQLTEATNLQGEPGPPGRDYPYGPYLPAGIPPNPYTGVNTVTATPTNPPTGPSGVGGWLYHEPTGQIWPDLPEHFE